MGSPFQKLCCIQLVNGQQPFLLAASGSVILSLDLKNGSILSRWPNEQNGNAAELDSELINGDSERPSKRRKVASEESITLSREASESSIEIISERKKGERRKPKVETAKKANISHLITSSDGATVVAVTAEDKTINVFQVQSPGELVLASQRFVAHDWVATHFLTTKM